MNLITGKTEFSDAEHQALAVQVRVLITAGLSQADVARQADNIAPATLSQYLSGQYTSEPGRTNVAVKLTKWLKAREADEAQRHTLPIPPPFMRLRGSQTITVALEWARGTGRLAQVIGVPGVSKTVTAKQFAEDYPNVFYAAMNPTTGGVPTMLLAVLRAMGDRDAKGTPQQLRQRVVDRVEGVKGLLIIDEAQRLNETAIETLRSINDEVRFGMVMLGNEEAGARLGPTGGKPEFAQVSSRISKRQWFAHPHPDDAADLARAWAEANREVISAREVEFCQQIAARAGGLRNIEHTMEGALVACRGAREPLALEHLQGAYAQNAATR